MYIYTINIIDTLESIYINFKEDHNDKIKAANSYQFITQRYTN